MRLSIKDGHPLPESAHEFLELSRQGRIRHMDCLQCNQQFSLMNTHCMSGWRETQITGFCEDCYDRLFGDNDA